MVKWTRDEAFIVILSIQAIELDIEVPDFFIFESGFQTLLRHICFESTSFKFLRKWYSSIDIKKLIYLSIYP